jgi:hypothetical protein
VSEQYELGHLNQRVAVLYLEGIKRVRQKEVETIPCLELKSLDSCTFAPKTNTGSNDEYASVPARVNLPED